MTFEKFILENHIKIPAIQRDYVQGRGSTIEERDKREAFVHKLLDAIAAKNESSCHLEFIYGTKDESNGHFIPLDGQQRLTTLFILHWVVWQKSTIENKKEKYPIKMLERFSYETRISSTNFCDNLIKKDIIEGEGSCSLRGKIENQPWFSEDWGSDPTVNAILSMIDCIEEKLNENNAYDVDVMLENLRSADYSAITFDELNMSDYQLSDSLYINMNARGKQLTPFENWKSGFIAMLEDDNSFGKEDFPYAEDDRKLNYRTFESYFTYSIEHQWTDLFWAYLMKDYVNLDLKKQEEEYPSIDNMFMNTFDLLCSYSYYCSLTKDNNSPKDFSKLNTKEKKEIYQKKQFLTFLMQSLDTLSRIKSNNFFNDLFYLSDAVMSENIQDNAGKVRLFRTECTDLLYLCNKYGAKMEIMDQLLFIALLKFCNKYHVNRVDDNVKLYMREVRNYLESVIQHLASRTVVQLNLRVADYSKYDKRFDELIEDNSFRIKTAEECLMEDCSWLCGHREALNRAIDSFGIKDTYTALKVFCDKGISDLQRVRILVACGYTGAKLGYCLEGRERRFFGGGDKWNVVFISDAENISSSIEAFVGKIKNGTRIPEIIDYSDKEYMNVENGKKPFAYYMLRYEHFACATDKPYHYAIRGQLDDVDIIALGSYSANPGSAYHTDPLARAVDDELKGRGIPLTLYKQYTGKCSLSIVKDCVYYEPIFSIKSRSNGWVEVDADDNETDIIYSYSGKDDMVQVGKEIIEKKYQEIVC